MEAAHRWHQRHPERLPDTGRPRRSRSGGTAVPQYPPVAATIDYVLPQGFAGDLTIEIVNAAGMVVRTVRSAGDGGGVGPSGRGSGKAAADARETSSTEQEEPELPQPAGGRGRAVGRPLTTRPGHNRFEWDYRWNGNGPMVAPGRYAV